MWRYRELLPVEETTPDTPLRVGWSPLYDEPNLARALGIRKLWVKDDGQNPTASLKDRPVPWLWPRPRGGAKTTPAPPPAMPPALWRATPPLRASRPISSCRSGLPRAR